MISTSHISDLTAVMSCIVSFHSLPFSKTFLRKSGPLESQRGPCQYVKGTRDRLRACGGVLLRSSVKKEITSELDKSGD